MLGQDLHALALVADLARSDYEGAPLTLIAQPGTIEAHYRANYSAGMRRVAVDDVEEEFTVAVHARQFKALSSLFDSESSVHCAVKNGLLHLTAEGRAVSLQAVSDGVDPLLDLDYDCACSVTLPAGDLITEFELAGNFVARSMAKQVLMGARVVLRGKLFGVTASDGYASVYASSMEAHSDEPGEAVLATLDCVSGLKLCTGDATFGLLNANRAVIYSENSYFYAAPLSGEWPDLSPLMKSGTYVSLIVSSSTVRDLIAAAAALSADPDLELRVTEAGQVVMRTVATEAGVAAIEVSGQLAPELFGVHRYDGSALQLATRLGDEFQLDLPLDPAKPVRISSGRRRYWIIAKR